MPGFEIRHLFDLLEEWDGLSEQAPLVEIIDLSNELLIDPWCLHDISNEPAEEGGRCVGCGNHEHKAFCFHLIDRDWSSVGILGGEDVVKEITSMVGFGVFESLFEEFVSELRLVSISSRIVFRQK